MRKEVKLGMLIGGGLVALLVAYLLIAPPNSNKKGANFSSTGENTGAQTIQQPGDLVPSNDPGNGGTVANASGNVGSGNVGGNTVATTGNTQSGNNQPGNVNDSTRGNLVVDNSQARNEKVVGNDKAGDKANTDNRVVSGNTTGQSPKLQNGSGQNVAGNGDDKVITHDPANLDGKTGTAKSDAGNHVGSTIGQIGDTAGQVKSMYYNPNDAWGGGVSTDAVTATAKAPAVKGNLLTAALDTPASNGQTHTVKMGESFSSISLTTFGSSAHWPAIAKANPGIDPKSLKPGMVLKLPAAGEIKTQPPVGSPHSGQTSTIVEEKIDPTHQYKVQQGDSLYRIAMKVYGKPTFVDSIYEKNKVNIGSNPTKLKLGMVLELPDKLAPASNNAVDEKSVIPPAGDSQQK